MGSCPSRREGIAHETPESWTEAVGISESVYHAASFGLGAIAGVATVVGPIILIYRRRTVGPVFSATTRNDKVMYVLLGLTLALGLGATMYGYLARPYIVYRSRDVRTPGESKPKRGWEPVGH